MLSDYIPAVLRQTSSGKMGRLTLQVDDLKWGGQSWETSSGKPSGKETFEKLDSNGTIVLEASSAALIYV
jgi:hypothetical protein